jgi:hypothetical protein
MLTGHACAADAAPLREAGPATADGARESRAVANRCETSAHC